MIVVIFFLKSDKNCEQVPQSLHYDLKWRKNGQNPQKIIFKKNYENYFLNSVGLYTHTGGVKKVFLGGQGGIKGVNNDDLLPKNTYFCYFWVILGIKPRINKFGRIWPLSS